MTALSRSPVTILAAALLTELAACSTPAARTSSEPSTNSAAGFWEGTFTARGHAHLVRLELRADSAAPSAFVGVPDQYALHYLVSGLALSPREISFSFPSALPPARFTGAIERGRIRGTFAAPADRDSIRGTFELWRRPPESPPYRTVEVRFRNGEVPLRGTLYLPNVTSRAPAVVFLHGSGPQTRESYLRFFADRIARRGIASLVYDKRNTGRTDIPLWQQGGGSFSELADDAAAAARVVRARPEIDSARVGFWGLSQGAWLGPMAAARSPGTAFVVLVSGGGVTPAEQELYDDEVKLRERGFPQPVIDSAMSLLRDADRYVRTGADADWNGLQTHLAAVRTRPWFSILDRFPLILPREAGAWSGLRPDLDYDPRPTLRQLTAPALVILGDRDAITPTAETARRIDSTLRAGGNRDVTMRLLPSAGHDLLVPTTFGISWVEQAPATGWIEEMTTWMLRRTQMRGVAR
jgi:pimeloyl-ACP methyl ester carboxylesterase